MPIEFCGKIPDTKKRYEILKSHVEKALNKAGENIQTAEHRELLNALKFGVRNHDESSGKFNSYDSVLFQDL